MFLGFYSAIFQLTSAKFQTFAYNSRTVWSSYMKFWQQFESNKLYVCTKFRGNRSRDFNLRTRKPPRKFGVKNGLNQKRIKYGKKYFIWLHLTIPFHPNQPIFGRDEVYFFFFFVIFVRSLFNPNTSKSNFCVKLLSCIHNFLGQLNREPPQNSIFWTAQARMLLFFAISRYLTDKHFDIV